MSIPIEFDDRYKVSQEIVDQMRELRRSTGLSYQKIADKFKVSYFTAYYWINESYRKKKQAQNAKKRPDPKYHVRNQVEKRRSMWKKWPAQRLIDYYFNAKNQKWHNVLGITMDELEDFVRKHQTGGQKIQ